VGGGLLVGQQTRSVQDERTGADRQHGFATGSAAPHEVDRDRVVDLCSCALAAGNEQVVKRRARVEGLVGVDGHPLRADDWIERLGHQQAVFGAT
jgi:hypothetical protein